MSSEISGSELLSPASQTVLAGISATVEPSTVVIRDVEAGMEMRAVEQVQRDVWGVPDIDVVPLAELVAAKTAGGVLIGAFDGDDLIGFVYGFVGYEHGEMTHHSHMLAVKPGYRNHRLGERLKLAQRQYVLTQGITTMSWTFDPLQSVNAYLNFSKLGVLSNRYMLDFYGEDASSFLHRNGTDRLWITWLLTSRRVKGRLEKTSARPEFGNGRPLVEVGEKNEPRLHNLDEGLSREYAAIEIPADINTLERRSSALAFEWRETTRQAFSAAIAAGFLVTDFARQNRGGQWLGRYLLSREKGFENFDS